MKPSSRQLAANVIPSVREYVNAYVAEALEAHEAKLSELIATNIRLTKEVAATRDEADAKMRKVLDRFNTDPAFTITKTKIMRLMQEMGIE